MKYYCLHHTPAVERKQYLEIFFEQQGIKVEWIEDFLPTCEEVAQFSQKIKSKHAAKNGILNNGEISLLLKHSLALKKICTINDYAIIFEDDIQSVDFKFNDIACEFKDLVEKNNIDVLWIGSSPNHGYNMHKTDTASILVNSSTNARLSHCYMLHSKLALRIYEEYCDFKHPSDWQWNHIIDIFKLRSAWGYPHIYQRTDVRAIDSLLR